MSQISPEVLIISNRHDFACDYISSILYEKGKQYLRLNTDDLSYLELMMDPINSSLQINYNDKQYLISESDLKTIYFRGPTYLRETSSCNLSVEDRLSQSQWAAFIRSLMIFERCKWINHPRSIYYAENKSVQLKKAYQVGFLVPDTQVTNTGKFINLIDPENESVVVKGIDTVYLNCGDHYAFAYTNVLTKNEIQQENISTAPIFLQKYVAPKIDLRVTVINNQVFAVCILENNKGIKGDWRLRKDNVTYNPIKLPQEIEQKCVRLVSELGLIYGAIDLVLTDNNYVFIEINPTGEWAWLVEKTELKIDDAIVNSILESDSHV